MSKKLIACVLTLSILLGFFIPMTANAQSSSIELTADNTVLQEGSTVKVNVIVKNVSDLFGIQFKINYPKDLLEYDSTWISRDYDPLGAQKIDVDKGEISNVLIMRNDASDKSFKERIELASFTFKALKKGTVSVSMSEIIAINSERYINDLGKKDVKTIDLQSSASIQLEIIAKQSGGSEPVIVDSGKADVNDSLKKIDELLNSNDINKAANQMLNLLDSLSSNISSEDKAKLSESISELSEKLLEFSPASVDENGKSVIALDSQALSSALSQLDTLLSKASAIGIDADVDKEITVVIPEDTLSEIRFSGSDIANLSAAGVNISLKSENVEIHIPSGSFDVDENSQLAITVSPEELKKLTQNGAEYNPVNAYNFEVEEISGGNRNKVSKFNKKVAIEVKYNPDGINENLLGLYTFNEETGMWEYIRAAKHDKEGNSFKAELEHFSKYAVIEFKRQYADISQTYDEAQNAISILSAKHIVDGINATQYAPKKELTRAEFTTMIVRALGIDLVKYKGSFVDVADGAWYTEYIEAAYKAGIVSGVGGRKFDPNSKITREQMAIMVTNAYEYIDNKLEASSDRFADDSSISDWASEYVYKARAAGLIEGVGQNRFNPKGDANRADAAVIILKLITKLELI